MYILFGLFFALCLFFFALFHFRKRKIIRKISGMDYCQKTTMLNELIEPFGFTYLPTQDIISSTVNAWQRTFGYHALFDRSATHFNMVFDCEPVYFDYDGRTWLIEFWKGQYGINIGAEAGIYCADSIVEPADYQKTHFESIADDQMVPISVVLYRGADPELLSEICICNCICSHGISTSAAQNCSAPEIPCRSASAGPVPLFWLCRRHWWLTGFRMGQYCEPQELAMRAAVTFPDSCMQQSFIHGLLQVGYSECDIRVQGLTVSFLFSVPHSAQPRKKRPLSSWAARRKNKCFCWLYQCFTRPFTVTCDKLLYLYYFLPVAFRHMLKFKKNRKQKLRRRRKTN